MRTVTCWDVQEWDGGDRTNHSFYVATKEEADKWKQKNTFDSVSERTIEIYDSLEEYQESRAEATKQRALAKLTPIERKALGF
jgi:hypothetical protein